MQFGLWRAAAFVSSPIHLLLLLLKWYRTQYNNEKIPKAVNKPSTASFTLIVMFLSTEIFSKRRKIYSWIEEKPDNKFEHPWRPTVVLMLSLYCYCELMSVCSGTWSAIVRISRTSRKQYSSSESCSDLSSVRFYRTCSGVNRSIWWVSGR